MLHHLPNYLESLHNISEASRAVGRIHLQAKRLEELAARNLTGFWSGSCSDHVAGPLACVPLAERAARARAPVCVWGVCVRATCSSGGRSYCHHSDGCSCI